jgi:hypothetical protein
VVAGVEPFDCRSANRVPTSTPPATATASTTVPVASHQPRRIGAWLATRGSRIAGNALGSTRRWPSVERLRWAVLCPYRRLDRIRGGGASAGGSWRTGSSSASGAADHPGGAHGDRGT